MHITDATLYGWSTTILLVVAIIVAVAWIVLPFALLGTKPILRELLREKRKTNELLRELIAKDSFTCLRNHDLMRSVNTTERT